MRMAARLEAMRQAKYLGTTRLSGGRYVWTGRVNLDRSSLEAPMAWRKPKRIFVNSMSDLFQESIPEDFIAAVWQVMAKTPWHTYQILTKRPARMRDVLSTNRFKILPNVWLGTSVEDQKRSRRISILREVPSHTRFISFEPLLGAIETLDLNGVHWAIVGGESGPGARQMKRAWVDAIRDACRRQGVAFFFKQWGGPNKKLTGRVLDGKTWDEYPHETTMHPIVSN
jgi:protein gp37